MGRDKIEGVWVCVCVCCVHDEIVGSIRCHWCSRYDVGGIFYVEL